MNIFRDCSAALLAFGLVAGSFARTCFAIDPNRALSQYVRDRWGAESGIPKGSVYAIAQTADGYLWIGTGSGLVRFDGLNFRMIPSNNPALTITNVLGLTPGIDGSLWVRLRRPTLARYVAGEFVNAMADLGSPRPSVAAMCQAQDRSLLLWVLEGEGSAIIQRGNRFETAALSKNMSRSPVLAIAQTGNSEVWLGTRDAGLFRLRDGQTIQVTQGLPDLKVNCLLATKGKDLWVGTDNGVVRWDGSRLAPSGLPKSLGRVRVLAMAQDADSNIWIGTNSHGLMRLDPQGVFSIDQTGNSAREAVTAVVEDREGNIWAGSASGIERLRDSAFVTYAEPEGLPSARNGPIYVDEQGRVWFAPLQGGLYWLDRGKTGQVAAGGVADDIVYSIAGAKGELWIGRQRGGLTRLRTGASSISATSYTRSDGLAQNSVYAVHQSRDGAVWAGTLSGGVSRFSDGKFQTYTTADGLASSTVSSILEDSTGTMWFGTPSGLSSFSKNRWRTYTTRDGLPSDIVNALLEDSKSALWIGTSAGLAVLRNGRIESMKGAPARLREQILGIAEDRNGALWVTTASGVLRAGQDALSNGAAATESLREYGVADGLHSVEGVKRHRSVIADSAGRIWLSMNSGISVADPSRLTGNSAPAIVHVQSILADGNPVDLRGDVRIKSTPQRLTFGYAGLTLAVPQRMRFRYRLDGFDSEWSDPVAAREAVYTNLGPATYRFRVIASNADGAWNGSESAVEFEIVPAFWQTGMFRLAIVLAFFASVAAFYRFRLRLEMRRIRLRYEERLAERTRIAQELHDTLLQGFLSASMQLHLAADRLPEESPEKPQLNRVLGLMRQVIEEGRNAVRGLRADHASHDLVQAFSRMQQELAAGQAADFRVIVEGESRQLHPVLRDEVYRIGREAVANAFRHAKARSIEIEMEYASKQFRLLVRDDGIGIAPGVVEAGVDGHWGLRGMRERAERIGGRLHVWSRASAGTEIELSVPAHIAFSEETPKKAISWWTHLRARLAPEATKQQGNEK